MAANRGEENEKAAATAAQTGRGKPPFEPAADTVHRERGAPSTGRTGHGIVLQRGKRVHHAVLTRKNEVEHLPGGNVVQPPVG